MKSITEIKRWATLRCEHCGHRFRWKRDNRFSFGNRDGKVYHGPCIAYLEARRQADERLEVLGWTLELAELTGEEVKELIDLRMSFDLSTLDQGGKAWRVFYELGKLRDDKERVEEGA